MAEPTQIHQIFMNLFTNASQAIAAAVQEQGVTIREIANNVNEENIITVCIE